MQRMRGWPVVGRSLLALPHDLGAAGPAVRRGMRAQLTGLLLVLGVVAGAVVVGDAVLVGDTLDPALFAGVLGAVLCAWGTAGSAAVLLPLRAAPAAVARRHRRARANRWVPRQLDPGAPGRTRSRAPSGPIPAV